MGTQVSKQEELASDSQSLVKEAIEHTKVYFCLGSNIQPHQNIGFAIRRVKQRFSEVDASNLYSSKAVGFEGDDFLNIVLGVNTYMSLAEVLDYADILEQEAGRIRVRRGRYDSRTLDVDVLMYGDLAGEHEGRMWPNQDLETSAHVLLPMSEVAGDVEHPVTGTTFNRLWEEFDHKDQALQRMESVF